jgi:hypothetical protein
LSALSGWEVAEEISKKTFNKLDVTSNDLIEANIKTLAVQTSRSMMIP